ncbi:MAG: hypothetical protein Q4B26_19810 [Eubacteriales bacterium]|nr:hypothetical protein [Eubacteriales bacterium]
MKPANETKAEKFVRVAEARVNKIIKMIRLLGNCSNPSNYEFRAQDVDKIFGTLQAELNRVRKLFILSVTGKKRFSLSSEENKDDARRKLLLPLPDGNILRAMVIDDEEFPSINIDLLDNDGKFTDRVCFAEYKSDCGPCYALHIGVYQSDKDEPTYYHSFAAEHQYSYSLKGNTLCVWEDNAIMAEISDVAEDNAESIFKEIVFEMRNIDLDENEPKGES